MSWIIDKATSPEILERAWRKSRNDNAVWRPGISRHEMEKRFIFHMMALAEDMRRSSYVPDPVRCFVINKGDGKTRTITALTLRDKVAQRAILSVIEPLGELFFHPDSYAYRPYRNIDMVIDRIHDFIHTGCTWAVSLDITDCFDAIPHQPLLAQISDLIQDNFAMQLIEKWITNHRSVKNFVSEKHCGIPQGAVISPFLCNLYLTSLDKDLTRHGINFVRYADNILVMTATRNKALSSGNFLKRKIQYHQLQLNSEKTVLMHIENGISFLGRYIYLHPVSRTTAGMFSTPSNISSFAQQFHRIRQFPRAGC